MINNALELESVGPYDAHLSDIGFTSAYFFNNIGTQLFVFFALILMFAVFSILNFFGWRNSTCRRGIRKGHQTFKDMLIATAIECYIMLAICSIIAFHKLGFDSFGEIIQSSTAIIAFTAVVLLPLSLVILYCCWDVIRPAENINIGFNVFLRDLPIEKGKQVALWPLYFLVRRLMLTLTTLLVKDLLVVQF